jgi:hypothetical protein
MKKSDLIMVIENSIASYNHDIEYEDELMAKKRTNKDIAKQCVKNYELVLMALRELEIDE